MNDIANILMEQDIRINEAFAELSVLAELLEQGS